MLYNVALVFAAQKRESPINIHISPKTFFFLYFPDLRECYWPGMLQTSHRTAWLPTMRNYLVPRNASQKP